MTVSRSTFLPFALPDIDEKDINQISDTIRSGWITTGPKTKLFEERFAEYIGVKYAIAVNSCTAAMHLALDAVELKPGDEVITTPYTFAATAEAITYFNAKPVLVDINAQSFNIDPDRVEAALTDRTRAIIPVHIAGLPVDMEKILNIAHQYDIRVIEDAAHALPSYYRGRMVGTFGDLSCFSFYATKTLTTGEGGMIVTDNSEWADRCRIMSLHGISKDAWKRYTAEGSWYYEIVMPGFKYNMPDITAAMGLSQLAKLERMLKRRCEIAMRYTTAFKALPELQVPIDRSDCQHAWHLYMMRLNPKRLSINRKCFIEELKRRNIGTSVHFIPLHIHPYYRQTYGYKPEDFPIAYKEYQREISLPIYSKMNDKDVEDVINGVVDIVERHRK